MRTIEIDEETFSYLASNAIPYVEMSPSETLKRLLGLAGTTNPTESKPKPLAHQAIVILKEGKSRKTSLIELVNLALLKDGQTLTFRDYRRTLFPAYKVKISQGDLLWNNKRYSMSELAKQILQKQGHSTDSVRGPIFWVTDDGRTVAEIWQKHLENSSNNM